MKEDKVKFTDEEMEYLRQGKGCLIWAVILTVVVVVLVASAGVLYFWR